MGRPCAAWALFWLVFLFLLASCSTGTADLVRVMRVIDGDTVEVQGGERVRYIGIDTPERGQPLGREATAKNRELVEGNRVRLENEVSDRDRYGRLLRHVWVDGLWVEAELVRLGLARAREYPPDTRYAGELARLEREARAARRGMWAGLSPALP